MNCVRSAPPYHARAAGFSLSPREERAGRAAEHRHRMRNNMKDEVNGSPSPPAAGGEGRGEEGHFCFISPLPNPPPSSLAGREKVHCCRSARTPDGLLGELLGVWRQIAIILHLSHHRHAAGPPVQRVPDFKEHAFGIVPPRVSRSCDFGTTSGGTIPKAYYLKSGTRCTGGPAAWRWCGRCRIIVICRQNRSNSPRSL